LERNETIGLGEQSKSNLSFAWGEEHPSRAQTFSMSQFKQQYDDRSNEENNAVM
jgi:hypothetical protein